MMTKKEGAMRYFVKFSNYGKAIKLYRFEVQTEQILEEIWNDQEWIWDADALIVGYLTIGEPDLDEVPENYAKQNFPDAFQ